MTNSPAGSLRHGPPLGFVRWHLPGASARQPACGVDALPRSLPWSWDASWALMGMPSCRHGQGTVFSELKRDLKIAQHITTSCHTNSHHSLKGIGNSQNLGIPSDMPNVEPEGGKGTVQELGNTAMVTMVTNPKLKDYPPVIVELHRYGKES